jgi:hypothetical protein
MEEAKVDLDKNGNVVLRKKEEKNKKKDRFKSSVLIEKQKSLKSQDPALKVNSDLKQKEKMQKFKPRMSQIHEEESCQSP